MIEIPIINILKSGTMLGLSPDSTREEILANLGGHDFMDDRYIVAGDLEIVLYQNRLECLNLHPFKKSKDGVSLNAAYRITGVDKVKYLSGMCDALIVDCIPFEFGFTEISSERAMLLAVNQRSYCAFGEPDEMNRCELCYIQLLLLNPRARIPVRQVE